MGPGLPVQILGAHPFRVAGNPAIEQVLVGVDFFVNRQEILHSGQDQGRLRLPEQVPQTLVDLAEIPLDSIFGVIGALAVKHGGPLASGAACPDAGAELRLLVQFIVFQGVGQTFGHPFQVVDGAETQTRPLEEPDLILA